MFHTEQFIFTLRRNLQQTNLLWQLRCQQHSSYLKIFWILQRLSISHWIMEEFILADWCTNMWWDWMFSMQLWSHYSQHNCISTLIWYRWKSLKAIVQEREKVPAAQNCNEIWHDGFFTWHRVFFSKTPTSNAEITIQKQWTELMIVLPAAKKKQGAVASHRRGWKKTKYPRNGSNKMESLTRVLEMRWRRRWKHEDKDKWAEDMFGAGEAASETALSGGLTQTDRAPPLRSRRSPSYSSLIPLKKSHNMFP